VFTREDSGPLPQFEDRPRETSLETVNFTVDAVLKKLKKLNVNKSCGPDEMHPRILFELKDEIAEPLFQIFRQSIHTGTLPDEWKTGQITPILKKGVKHLAKNYRPMSLTSKPCKLLEQLVREDIVTDTWFNQLEGPHSLNLHNHTSSLINNISGVDPSLVFIMSKITIAQHSVTYISVFSDGG